MLLSNKTAIIYGAYGSIGTAVAEAFAREGAKVCITGKRLAPLEWLANKIVSAGGEVEIAFVDALDEQAVNLHAETFIDKYGQIDISFNAIGVPVSESDSTFDNSLQHFEWPALCLLRSQYITTQAAAKCMRSQNTGTIMMLTAKPPRGAFRISAAHLAAFSGLEAYSTMLARELDPHQIKLMCLRSASFPMSPTYYDDEAYDIEGNEGGINFLAHKKSRRVISPLEIAEIAALVAGGNYPIESGIVDIGTAT